jgi:hypothetical protein
VAAPTGTHVVETVKEGDQVVAAAGIVGDCGNLEAAAVTPIPLTPALTWLAGSPKPATRNSPKV